MPDPVYHVYPLNDEKEHVLEGLECPCKPKQVWKEDMEDYLVVHRAYDCREVVEEAERILRATD